MKDYFIERTADSVIHAEDGAGEVSLSIFNRQYLVECEQLLLAHLVRIGLEYMQNI
jgi:hypothetical protein